MFSPMPMNNNGEFTPQVSPSPSTPENYTRLRNENETLKAKIQHLEDSMNADRQQLTIQSLRNTNRLQTEKIDSLQDTVKLYEEMLRYETSQTSRKARVQKTMKENGNRVKTLRDTMQRVIFHRCKFAPKEHIRTIYKDRGIAYTMMKELRVEEEREKFWACTYEIVENLLVEHRTHAAAKMKRSFRKGKKLLDT